MAISTSMPLPPRAARLAFFVYDEPIWSMGDRLRATFDFDSDDALRAALGPIGLAFLADEKVLEQRVRVLQEFEVDADVFGHLVTLAVGPEDRYEHLGDADYDLAEALEASFHAAGLERYKIDPPHWEDVPFPARPPPARPPKAAGPPRFLVELEGSGPDGFRARVRERLGGQPTSFDRVDLTAETRVVDLGASAPAEAFVLEAGQLAIATMTIAMGTGGMMDAAVDRLELIRPDPALVAKIAEAFAVLTRTGMLAEAKPPWQIARDFLLRREVYPTFTVQALLDETLDKELSGRTVEGYPLLSHHVGWALLALRQHKLPCLFSAHRAVADAVARCKDSPPEQVREALFHEMVGELHRSLDRAGDPRRFLPVRLLTRPEALTYLLLTPLQRRALLDAGLADDA